MKLYRALGVAIALAATIAVPSALAAPPANDAWADAATYVNRGVTISATNVDATKEPDEPDHAGNAGGASIWYAFTPYVDGRATVSTCGSDFNTLLGVYTGTSLPSLTLLVSNNDGCGSQSQVTFQATAGTTYYVAVDGFDGATGDVWLTLRVSPPNDDFADAAPLSGNSGSLHSTTEGSGTEAGEPYHVYGSNSVWYSWTAPSSGWATFETCGIGTPFDSVLAIYTGSQVDDLAFVAGNDDGCGSASRVAFQASENTTYRIAVAGYAGSWGDFTLTWNRNAPPPSPLDWPQVLGQATDGEMLTATDGAWAGEPPFTFTYAWGRCDRYFDECSYVEGATAKTFAIRSVDVGHRLYVRVTASNGSGSAVAYSDATAVIAARPPVNVLPPTISGNARPGAVLVATGGTWSGTTPLTFTYQWQSCAPDGGGCTDLTGQTGQVMQVPGEIVGERVRVAVTATNAGGSASAPSEATATIRQAEQSRCLVPNVRKKTLSAARAAIRRGHCKVGRVRKVFSNRVAAGRVVGQTPRGGRRLAIGSRVHLLVSKGKRR